MAYPENVGSVRKPTFGKLGGNDGFVPDHVSSTRQPCNERMAAFDELAGAWERPLCRRVSGVVRRTKASHAGTRVSRAMVYGDLCFGVFSRGLCARPIGVQGRPIRSMTTLI